MRIDRLCLLLTLIFASITRGEEKIPADTFGIEVLDADTKRGVPLIEVKTVNDVSHFTDSRGWVAFREPGLMKKEVFFHVAGPGYEHAKDGFGFRGTRLTTTPGTSATIKVKRTYAAERMGRLTGQGIERDSTLLGFTSADAEANDRGGVLGQDSVQAVPYRGRLFWLWGDTNLAHYPFGNFNTTSATSPLPDGKKNEPIRSVSYTYFMDPAKPERVRAMMPSKEPGPVWLFGLLTVKDEAGTEVLLSHFTRRKNLGEQLEHGLCRFDDEAGVFKKVTDLDLKETWRFPRNNAFRVTNDEGDYFYFAAPFAHTRVKAILASVRDSSQYEAHQYDPTKRQYVWQRDLPPTTQADEAKLLKANEMPRSAARYTLTDASNQESVSIHTASITWNGYRKKWLLIGLQQAWSKSAPSHLGEVWYAEADSPTGPWTKAVKVATHPNYSFYNPRIHDFFTQEEGKVIYFEGTYTNTFSGNTTAVPRYEYNQLLYRLDLSDERLKVIR